ncbi:hypothetical protein SLEP1_g15250 [Rubroshorea leprosula]|uniref:Uncharacterized protein n=1 Tax=Rubroshorea leprosula TaxID=152421 RepID=A0AAV5ILR4_9ROSI|nr:hypothetical protein SLEP1_g15250 [Rubroshorea leprosula]
MKRGSRNYGSVRRGCILRRNLLLWSRLRWIRHFFRYLRRKEYEEVLMFSLLEQDSQQLKKSQPPERIRRAAKMLPPSLTVSL